MLSGMDELARRRAIKAAQEQKLRKLAVVTATADGIILNANNVSLDALEARALAELLLDCADDLE